MVPLIHGSMAAESFKLYVFLKEKQWAGLHPWTALKFGAGRADMAGLVLCFTMCLDGLIRLCLMY